MAENLDPVFRVQAAPGQPFVGSGQAQVPDAITAEWLAKECEQLERVLRLQYLPEGRLDPVAEEEIQRWKPVDSTYRGMKLWWYLKHLYQLRSEGRSPGAPAAASPPVSEEERMETMRLLLNREPVRIRIGANRIVGVTSRSLAAMEALRRHELRRRMLILDMDRIAALIVRTEARVGAGAIVRRLARRQLRRLCEVHERTYVEYVHQTRALLANALTESGAPARPEEAPSWWVEVTPEDEARIFAALWEAGPGRLGRLGPRPAPKTKSGMTLVEDYGFHSLLEAFARDWNLPPAAMRDVDLAQLIASSRASALEHPEAPPSKGAK